MLHIFYCTSHDFRYRRKNPNMKSEPMPFFDMSKVGIFEKFGKTIIF